MLRVCFANSIIYVCANAHAGLIAPIGTAAEPLRNASGAMQAKAGTVESGVFKSKVCDDRRCSCTKKMRPPQKKGTHDFLPEKAVFLQKIQAQLQISHKTRAEAAVVTRVKSPPTLSHFAKDIG